MAEQLPLVDFGNVGPTIGRRFPDLRLPNQHGELVDIHESRGHRRALVVFYRSASW